MTRPEAYEEGLDINPDVAEDVDPNQGLLFAPPEDAVDEAQVDVGEEKGVPVEDAPEAPEGQTEESGGYSYNQLAARNRILERDMGVLGGRFDQVMSMMQGLASQQQQPQEEASKDEPIDPDEDPGRYLIDKVEKISDRMEANEQQGIDQQRLMQQQGVVNAATAAAKATWDQNPENSKQALSYLYQLSYDDMASLYPNMTEQDISSQIQNELTTRVVMLHQQGQDPGQAILDMATRRGFAGNNGALAEGNDTPVQQVKKAQVRQRKSRSLSNVKGGSSGVMKNDAKSFLKLTEDQFADKMRETGLTFADLLKGKGRESVSA